MSQDNFKQTAFDFYSSHDFSSVESFLERIKIYVKDTLEGIEELSLTCKYASTLTASTLQVARQIFESHFKKDELQSQEALWHSFAHAYILQMEHELDVLGQKIIQFMKLDSSQKITEIGMYEIGLLIKTIQKKDR